MAKNPSGPALKGKSLMLRDQDLLDMWIVDHKGIIEIASELGMAPGSVSTRIAVFRKAGFKVPRRNPDSTWIKGEPLKRIVLIPTYIDKIKAAQNKK